MITGVLVGWWMDINTPSIGLIQLKLYTCGEQKVKNE
jgi:hypothetical protein